MIALRPTRTRPPMRVSAMLAAATIVLTACGGTHSSSSSWSDLARVNVTVARPGLPPPGGLPKTTAFSSKAELARVTTALNTYKIAKRSPVSSSGCAGGEQVKIEITRTNGSHEQLSGYRCAGQTSGAIGGDLSGFLSAIGVSGS